MHSKFFTATFTDLNKGKLEMLNDGRRCKVKENIFCELEPNNKSKKSRANIVPYDFFHVSRKTFKNLGDNGSNQWKITQSVQILGLVFP